MPDDPTPRRRGRPRKFTPRELADARERAAALDPPRMLRSAKSQQDFIWEEHARAVIADWKRRGMPAGDEHSLDWWEERSRHSTWAELGRLNNPIRIIVMTLRINADRPAGTREAREAIRDYRRTMEAVDKGRDEVRIRGRVFDPEKLARLVGYLPPTPPADSPDG
jgi:hypothetical protein